MNLFIPADSEKYFHFKQWGTTWKSFSNRKNKKNLKRVVLFIEKNDKTIWPLSSIGRTIGY